MINYSLTEIVVCFIVVGYAAVDLVPCDRTRRVFQSSWGVITDGPVGFNYTQDSHCEWLIKANGSKQFITLSFRSMGTECSYDYVFVYDGDSFNSPLLGSFSGKTEPQKSDSNIWIYVKFSITDCPNNCSSHGVCYDHQCVCEGDWGVMTALEGCAQKTAVDNEDVDTVTKVSVWNKWHWLSHSEGGLQPRAAHSAVYIEMTDSLYVFGGYNLNVVLGSLEIYNFQTSNWRNENGEVLPDKGLLSLIEPSSIAKLIEHAGRDWEQKWGLNTRTSFLRNLLYTLRAQFSELHPPHLTRHTLTCANDIVYLFGGSTTNGEFSSRLYSIKLNEELNEQWQEIKPRGGKQLDIRVYMGGIVAGVARFSKLSDRMFAFQVDHLHWTEIHYTREHLREKFVPRERAFHTADIFGNYLVIFGGYSHRHNKEEICYDNQMYLYHLGCHTWVNPEILGKTNESRYPKQQGVFAHASGVRNDNTLLLVGGYHGNVNGDLLAYTVPPMIATRKGEVYEPESACIRHRNYGECSGDPECGWCSADEQCYGRTVGANCTTNLQTTRCPGILSASHKLGLEECTWCVQNARCHHKDDNYGVCGLQEDSPSQIPGWWGSKGTEIVKPSQCREFDRRPGLTFVKYHHPVNLSQPDHVAIINATTVDFNGHTHSLSRADFMTGGEMVARLLGFLRLPPNWEEMLNVCISHCSATLTLADDLIVNVTAEQKDCKSVKWPKNLTFEKVPVDFKSKKIINLGSHNSHFQQSKMELQHYKDSDDPFKFFVTMGIWDWALTPRNLAVKKLAIMSAAMDSFFGFFIVGI
ncbi:hypothetical protein NQ317_015870 [Molorchus minor]|uniref:CUB domain-containing protein n=1 Tax=Molorchus minor TaxID=1323400 RepID=A0ABQ9JIM3_9CUCU|nr:hypothetical protein NQ317_015870 [Molorchus minor]